MWRDRLLVRKQLCVFYDLEAQTTGSYQAIGREAGCSKVRVLLQETSERNGKRDA